MYFDGFTCIGCGARVEGNQDVLLCPSCGNLLEATYDYAALARTLDRERFSSLGNGVWQWVDLLPVVDRTKIVSLGEGQTPLIESKRLAELVGVRELWLLSEATGNPTGSLKDRSITVSATKAVEFGYPVLSCDSTGNKASSVAAYAARAGLESVVFCPRDTPAPKVAQALFFGAELVRVEGHYSEINAMYNRLIQSGSVRWYDCGTANPYRYEGKKTYAYQIAQQLGWRVPDRIVQPAAGGMSIAKAWKGFGELKALGWTNDLPRMTAVQAQGCAPIVEAWRSGAPTVAPVEKQSTIATAIAVADPGLLGNHSLNAIYASGGAATAVGDAEILEAAKVLGQHGFFIEPSGAVALSGLKRLVADDHVDPDESVVCVLTGSGFKDFGVIEQMITLPDAVATCYDDILAFADRNAGKRPAMGEDRAG